MKIKTCLPLLILALAGTTPLLAGEGDSPWLPPQQEVFPLLWADPRSAQFYAQAYKQAGNTLSSDAIGHQIDLWRTQTGRGGTVQVGLEASAFLRLSLSKQGQNAALQDSDWFVGFPVEYKKGPWGFRLWTFHTSSHLGDNYLITNGITPITYSRESVEGLISYSFAQLVLYGGGSHTFHTIPDVDGGALHGGAQAWTKPLDAAGTTALYAAADVQPKGEVNWRIQTNLQAGVAVKPRGSDKRMRVYIDYATGPSPEGQFYNQNLSYLAGGVAFDF
jgi:hypothetical protein